MQVHTSAKYINTALVILGYLNEKSLHIVPLMQLFELLFILWGSIHHYVSRERSELLKVAEFINKNFCLHLNDMPLKHQKCIPTLKRGTLCIFKPGAEHDVKKI